MIATERLNIEEIRRRLSAEAVGRHIYLFGEVTSTNARLKALARAGAAAGTVVLAEGQSEGRGRHGRPWFSPSGVNLYVSVLLRPAVPPRQLGLFSLIASLALADAIKEFGVSPGIKWPNDVLIEGKKVGGTLVESRIQGEHVDDVVVGVGVNLNVDPAALRAALGPGGAFATSLSEVTGREIDRNAFAAAYLNSLDRWARTWVERGPAAILAAWSTRDILTGRRVEVRGTDGAFQGRAAGLTVGGTLLVQDTLGRPHTLLSEEVRILD